KPVIIDWPQYVYKDHPMALRLLERDVKYIARYFEKTFRVKIDVDEVIKRITTKESVSMS
ncbi:MAG: RIO1 family regulatory kinase/ATPase, partial [Fervidicoccaceae archaeon]